MTLQRKSVVSGKMRRAVAAEKGRIAMMPRHPSNDSTTVVTMNWQHASAMNDGKAYLRAQGCNVSYAGGKRWLTTSEAHVRTWSKQSC